MQACTLLYGASDRDANMLYFAGVMVPDPFIAFEVGGRKVGVVNALEYGRVRARSSLDEVLSYEEWSGRAGAQGGNGRPVLADIVAALAHEYGLGHFRVADDFPAGLAFALRERGLGVDIAEGMLLPERALKNDREAREIRAGNKAAAAGFKVAERLLGEAGVRDDGKLAHEGELLTSGRLRVEIQKACLEQGALAAEVIAAGGRQACDPHERGHGPLRAGELIIIDIFPRVSKSGYFGDMTRTYLKGKASGEQKKLVKTVREAQKRALDSIAPGKSGRKLYEETRGFFDGRGYPTERRGHAWEGFFHGLGHGLGLDIHEYPGMGSRRGGRLRRGHVITVEPGLYYPGLGGCRIEDVVRVTEGGCEMLSRHPCKWRID